MSKSIAVEDIRQGTPLYAQLVIGSLTDEEWETVKAEILAHGIPEEWRELLKGALTDESSAA